MVATLPTFFLSPVFVICTQVCVHVCMDMDTHEYVHTCGGPWLMTAIILDRSSTLFIVAGSLHQTQGSPVWLVSLASSLWGSPVSVHLTFHMGPGDSNCGRHAPVQVSHLSPSCS